MKAGQRFTITNRGRAIADLVPSEDAERGDPRAVIEKFRKFMAANPVKRRVNARALMAEGRE